MPYFDTLLFHLGQGYTVQYSFNSNSADTLNGESASKSSPSRQSLLIQAGQHIGLTLLLASQKCCINQCVQVSTTSRYFKVLCWQKQKRRSCHSTSLRPQERTVLCSFGITLGLLYLSIRNEEWRKGPKNCIYFQSHQAHFSGNRICFLRMESFLIYSFTLCRGKKISAPQQHMDFFFFYSCQKAPNKTSVIFSLLPTLEPSL